MPCRCEEDYPNVYETEKRIEQERCRDRATILRLAKLCEENGVKITGRLAKNVKAARAALLTHKREEHQQDVEAFRQKLIDYRTKMASVQGRMAELPSIERQLDALASEIRDAEAGGHDASRLRQMADALHAKKKELKKMRPSLSPMQTREMNMALELLRMETATDEEILGI